MLFIAEKNGARAEWSEDKLRFIGDRSVIKQIEDIMSISWFCDDSFANAKAFMESFGYRVQYTPDNIPDDILR